MYNAVFNSNNLGTGDYKISKIDVAMPSTDVNKYKLVRSDGQIVTSKFYGGRTIKVSGSINANNYDQMQARLDTLKTWVDGYGKPLDITLGNTVRRYTATVDSFNYKTQGYFCEWDILFTCDSIGYDSNNTALTFGTYTSSNTSYSNTIGGTYKTYPYLELQFNYVVPYWSAKYLQLKNPITNEYLRITKQWLPQDKIVINGLTKQVQMYQSSLSVVDSMDTITYWASAHTLTLETVNQMQGVGASKVVMGSAGTSSYVQRLNTGITDMSSTAGKVMIAIFIPTLTSGVISKVTLQIGSDVTLGSNYCNYEVTTQLTGSAITANAWNYFAFDLSTSPTSTTGSPVRTAIRSISIIVSDGSNFQANGLLFDYLVISKSNPIISSVDYEGLIPSLNTNANSLVFEDELTSRNITITGNYYKRYL